MQLFRNSTGSRPSIKMFLNRAADLFVVVKTHHKVVFDKHSNFQKHFKEDCPSNDLNIIWSKKDTNLSFHINGWRDHMKILQILAKEWAVCLGKPLNFCDCIENLFLVFYTFKNFQNFILFFVSFTAKKVFVGIQE